MAEPAATEQGGLDEKSVCLRIVEEETEMVCGLPAIVEVLVRNDFALFAMPLCKDCERDHRKFYAERRARRGTRHRRR